MIESHSIYKLFFISILIALAGCNSANTKSNASETPVSSTTETVLETDNRTKIDDSVLISSQGIGEVRLGMTFAELRKSLLSKSGKITFEVNSPFMVNWNAIAVNRDGETLYYILFPANNNFSDSSKIEYVLTENSDYRTDKGVGVGMKIEDVESRLGKATLTYNTSNEQREYVTFTNQPKNIGFRASTSPQDFAGIYKPPQKEYNETNQFREDASIKSVLVGK